MHVTVDSRSPGTANQGDDGIRIYMNEHFLRQLISPVIPGPNAAATTNFLSVCVDRSPSSTANTVGLEEFPRCLYTSRVARSCTFVRFIASCTPSMIARPPGCNAQSKSLASKLSSFVGVDSDDRNLSNIGPMAETACFGTDLSSTTR